MLSQNQELSQKLSPQKQDLKLFENKKQSIKKVSSRQNKHHEYVLAQRPTANYIYYKKFNPEMRDFEGHSFKVNQLNAAEFQYLIDKDKLRWFQNDKEPDNFYMGFNNFPSIVETVSPVLKISKSKKDSFIDICEGGDRDVKIETSREQHFRNLWKEQPELILPAKKITYPKINGKIERVEKDIQIKQDITYVRKLLEDLKNLEEILKNNKGLPSSNICDLSYSVKDFLIIEKKQYTDLGEVLIVGYPAEMNTFFKVSVQDPNNSTKKISFIELLKRTVFEEHKKSETDRRIFNNGSVQLKENYCKLLVELHNVLLNETPEDQQKKINIDDFDDYYKLIKIGIRPAFLENLLKKKEEKDIINKVEEPMSFEEFDQLLNKILQNKIKGIFSRPNTKIRYVFFPFLKRSHQSLVNVKYEPLIYNVRELEPRHKPVLERILELIQTELPRRFNILKEGETSHTNFYTYYRYGDIFHIKTEYLHPTTNIEFYSHVFRRIIKLEELIYSCSILNDDNRRPFWSNVKFEYQARDYRIEDVEKTLNMKNTQIRKMSINNNINNINKQKRLSNYTEYPLSNNNIINNSNDSIYEQLKISKVIVLREYISSTYQLYTKNKNGKFYFIKLEPILDKLNFDNFLNPLLKGETVYNCLGEVTKNHLCNQPIFKVLIKEINNLLNLEEKKKINFFYNIWNFPVLRVIDNSKIKDRQFIGLTDKETIDFLKYINYINKFYSYQTYNIMNATEKINPDVAISNVVSPDKKKKCETSICDNYYYNFKVEFDLDKNKYLLVINNIKLLKDGHDTRYVIWVFINPSKKLESKKKISNFLDLNDPRIIEEIIKQIKKLKIYDPTKDFLGVNTYIPHDYKILHIHIFHNKKQETYQSFITNDNFISTETRLENLYNVLYKLKKSKTYYTNFQQYISFQNYFLDTL